MTQHPEAHNPISAERGERAMARVVADLECVYRAVPAPHLGVAMDRAVHESMTAPRGLMPRRGALVRRRIAPVAAALLFALSGVAGYLRVSSPAPVSAQTVLHRAAALRLAPHQAGHFTYTVTLTDIPLSNGGKGTDGSATASGTAEVWIQTDASGAPTLSAQTLTLTKGPDTAARVFGRYVQIGQQVYGYDAGHDAILLTPEARAYPSWALPNDIFDGAGTADYLSTLTPQSGRRVQLLPRQTLDGVAVDVILVDGWTDRPGQRTTLYFDAQSAVLRGFDAVSNDPSYPTPAWHVRLSAQASMADTAVPAGTFALQAPATAHVQLEPLKADLFTAFASTCHTTANIKDILKHGQQTLLAVCQATTPGMTAATLAAALAAPQQHDLDAAVSAGVITPTQAADSLSSLQAWLTTWVATTPTHGPASDATGSAASK